MDTCNQKYIKITYKLVKRQETRYMIFHQEKYIQIHIDYLIE